MSFLDFLGSESSSSTTNRTQTQTQNSNQQNNTAPVLTVAGDVQSPVTFTDMGAISEAFQALTANLEQELSFASDAIKGVLDVTGSAIQTSAEQAASASTNATALATQGVQTISDAARSDSSNLATTVVAGQQRVTQVLGLGALLALTVWLFKSKKGK